jgi:hypothetical protein
MAKSSAYKNYIRNISLIKIEPKRDQKIEQPKEIIESISKPIKTKHKPIDVIQDTFIVQETKLIIPETEQEEE